MLLDLITTLRRPSVVALTAALAVTACREGGDRPSATELQTFIALHCEQADACNCEGTVVADTCNADLTDRWNDRVRYGEQHELTYDTECFETITGQVESYGCYQPGGETPLCGRFCAVFYGDRAEGDACEGLDALVSNCGQGLVCDDGTCRPPCAVLGGRGLDEPCASELLGSYDDCAAGLACNWQTSTCQPRSGEGQPCNGECLEGLYCDWQTDTCMKAPTEGESCGEISCAEGLYCNWNELDIPVCTAVAQEGESCSNNYCAEPLYCNDASVCQAAPGVGQPCLFGYACEEGLVCDSSDTGLCRELPVEGEQCYFGECGQGTWCRSSSDDPEGTCIAPMADGEMCSGHRQCDSGYCPNGFCWPRPGLGEACDGAGVCAPGLVCNGESCEPTLTRAPAVCSYPGF